MTQPGGQLCDRQLRRDVAVEQRLEGELEPVAEMRVEAAHVLGKGFVRAKRAEPAIGGGGALDRNSPLQVQRDQPLCHRVEHAPQVRVAAAEGRGARPHLLLQVAVGLLQAAARGLHLAVTAGHGFSTGPVIGRLLAEAVVRGEAPLDLEPFRPSRFEDGAVQPARKVL